jgi:hypothetical protein
LLDRASLDWIEICIVQNDICFFFENMNLSREWLPKHICVVQTPGLTKDHAELHIVPIQELDGETKRRVLRNRNIDHDG